MTSRTRQSGKPNIVTIGFIVVLLLLIAPAAVVADTTYTLAGTCASGVVPLIGANITCWPYSSHAASGDNGTYRLVVIIPAGGSTACQITASKDGYSDQVKTIDLAIVNALDFDLSLTRQPGQDATGAGQTPTIVPAAAPQANDSTAAMPVTPAPSQPTAVSPTASSPGNGLLNGGIFIPLPEHLSGDLLTILASAIIAVIIASLIVFFISGRYRRANKGKRARAVTKKDNEITRDDLYGMALGESYQNARQKAEEARKKGDRP